MDAISFQDDDLLAEFPRESSDDAFDQIMERYRDFVYSLCRRCLGDAHLAEDATQVTFARLARRAGKLKFSCLSAYLKRTARSIARDMARHDRSRRSAEISLEQFSEDHPDALLRALAFPSCAVLDERAREAVSWAMERMKNPQSREAVALRVVENCTIEGVADIQKISRDAAAKRIRRGLRELGKIMRAEGYNCSFALLALAFCRLRIIAAPLPPSATAPPAQPPAPPPALSLPRLISPLKLFGALAAVLTLASVLAVGFLPRSQRGQTQSAQPVQGTQQGQAASLPAATPAAVAAPILAPPAVANTLTFDDQLHRKLVGIVSDRQSLQDSFWVISTISGIEIDADWDAIAAVGVDLHYTPGWHYSNMSVLEVLDAVLEKFCPGKLEYVVADQHLVVRPRQIAVSTPAPSSD